MGRRAKSKQGAPLPYEPNVQKEPSKKLGKRKAQSGDLEHSIARPLKKTKSKVKYLGPEPRQQDSKKHIAVSSSDEETSRDGWEDVENLHTERM